MVEVDIIHTDIDELQLYVSMRIPEFRRYSGETSRIYSLQGSAYVEVETNPTFAVVPKPKLYEFLADAQLSEIQADQALHKWGALYVGKNLLRYDKERSRGLVEKKANFRTLRVHRIGSMTLTVQTFNDQFYTDF